MKDFKAKTASGLARAAAYLVLIFALAAHAGATSGPTIALDHRGARAGANAVSDFMYFVPLISPTPVSTMTSPGSSQMARLTAATRRATASSFVTTCDFEFTGSGTQRSIFDLTPEIHRHEQSLKQGVALEHQLRSIIVNGPGAISVEVNGVMSNDVRVVNEVRLHFNARGQQSPVLIDMCDIESVGGRIKPTNEILARVNSLVFRRAEGPPKMEVGLASVKDKDAGDSVWQNFKGRIKGAAANLFLPPMTVEDLGNRAMLDFGLALVTRSPNFTFPVAHNLISTK